jgi:hypothetical protein
MLGKRFLWLVLVRKGVSVGHALGYGLLLVEPPVHHGGYVVLFLMAITAVMIEFSVTEGISPHPGAPQGSPATPQQPHSEKFVSHEVPDTTAYPGVTNPDGSAGAPYAAAAANSQSLPDAND